MDETSWLKNEKCLRSAYFGLIVIRFVWTLLPQTGYVYPDEFFQSPEIMAKDYLLINTTVTWEWNEKFPVRSPLSAFLTSGIPYMVLKALCNVKLLKLNSYLLLVFPRIYMTLLSALSIDMPVYVLCGRLNLDPFNHLFVLSSSYVMQVLATRPFSNVLETGIFGILLVLLIPRNQSFSFNKPASEGEQVETDISKLNCMLIGGLTSLGFFCRPTFIVFALVPLVASFFSQLRWGKKCIEPTKIIQVIIRMVLIAFGFFIVSVLIVLLDSWYFGYLQKGAIVFTPWNFIKYNAMQAHKHGHHPIFTHFLVNIPLLFGPIAFLWYSKLVLLLLRSSLFARGHHNNEHDCSTDDHLYLDYKYHHQFVLAFAVLVPVLVLSFIPHQEPRFIMPVIIPLILLLSHKIVGPKHLPVFLLSWCVWNAIGCLFFGLFHQGGIIPSLLHLENVIKNNVKRSYVPFCHHIIYFHTYMPPTHLLGWPKKIPVNGHKLYIHDLAGSSQKVFLQTKSKLKKDYCDGKESMVRQSLNVD